MGSFSDTNIDPTFLEAPPTLLLAFLPPSPFSLPLPLPPPHFHVTPTLPLSSSPSPLKKKKKQSIDTRQNNVTVTLL